MIFFFISERHCWMLRLLFRAIKLAFLGGTIRAVVLFKAPWVIPLCSQHWEPLVRPFLCFCARESSCEKCFHYFTILTRIRNKVLLKHSFLGSQSFTCDWSHTRIHVRVDTHSRVRHCDGENVCCETKTQTPPPTPPPQNCHSESWPS